MLIFTPASELIAFDQDALDITKEEKTIVRKCGQIRRWFPINPLHRRQSGNSHLDITFVVNRQIRKGELFVGWYGPLLHAHRWQHPRIHLNTWQSAFVSVISHGKINIRIGGLTSASCFSGLWLWQSGILERLCMITPRPVTAQIAGGVRMLHAHSLWSLCCLRLCFKSLLMVMLVLVCFSSRVWITKPCHMTNMFLTNLNKIKGSARLHFLIMKLQKLRIVWFYQCAWQICPKHCSREVVSCTITTKTSQQITRL